jgi:hypothetical protein
MPRRTREVERIKFDTESPETIIRYMAQLAAVRDGWLNLLPQDTPNEAPTTPTFFAQFGGGGIGITMCTWLPPQDDRPGRDHCEVGISHTSGKRARAELASLGRNVPESWTVKQDHPRRGLVLYIPKHEPHDVVLLWALRAAAALSGRGQITQWLAEVHLPL